MTHLQLLSVAALAAATTAVAQDRPADWIKRPSLADIQAVWPSRALKEGYGGKATIACVVTVQGALRGCRVQSETPEGGGFGSAAIALSSQFMMRPALKGGAPVESIVTIPINFPKPDKATGSRLRPITDSDFKGERIFTGLPWRTAPTYDEVVAAYPAKARAAKVSGSATLDCRIDKSGRLVDCRNMHEAPERYGFTDAARSLISRFSTPVEDGKGQSIVGDRVHLRISFDAGMLTNRVIGKPDWTAFPTMDDLTAVIPPAARQAKVYKARVVMECKVAAEGALGDCTVLSEEPASLDYGKSAQALAPYFRLSVWTAEGLPVVGGSVKVPIRFDLAEAMAAKP